MKKKTAYFLLFAIALFLVFLNYNLIDNYLSANFSPLEKITVTRIIDGDTVVLSGDEHVRLLGINTPEHNEMYFSEAKNFTEKFLLNKEVELEFGKEKKDLYNRTLAFIFLDGKNFNKELVKSGLAGVYYPEEGKYESEFREAWNECLASGKNLCEKSKGKCADCITLKSVDIKSQIAIFKNSCNYSCQLNSWTLKDEGRKKFTFGRFSIDAGKDFSVIVSKEKKENTKSKIYWARADYVWTESGDSIFLRDESGKLVLFYSW